MSDVLAWCFHSPRRLLLVVVVLLAAVLGIGVAVQALTPQGRAAPARTTPTAAAVAETGPALDAAVTFARAWASKPPSDSPARWRQTLQPLVTPELARLLQTTDPAQLPGGAPSGQPVVRFVSAASALVEVPLSTGRRVLVTTVLLGDRWLVSDVQPAEGDAGDVGGGADVPSASASGSKAAAPQVSPPGASGAAG